MTRLKKLSRRLFQKISFFILLATGFSFMYTTPVVAQEPGGGLLPNFIADIVNQFGGDTLEAGSINTFIERRVKMGLTILFVVVFLVAIVYSALAAIKFISSQGDASKLEESKNAVKAILMGFAAMILSIVGIFAIIFILGGESGPPTVINVDPENYS